MAGRRLLAEPRRTLRSAPAGRQRRERPSVSSARRFVRRLRRAVGVSWMMMNGARAFDLVRDLRSPLIY